MKLVEAIKDYARNIKTDKTLLDFLNTEHEVAMYDPCIMVEDVAKDWLAKFQQHLVQKNVSIKHVSNVQKVIKGLSQ